MRKNKENEAIETITKALSSLNPAAVILAGVLLAKKCGDVLSDVYEEAKKIDADIKNTVNTAEVE